MNVPAIILVGIPTGNKLPLNEKMHFIICETEEMLLKHTTWLADGLFGVWN